MDDKDKCEEYERERNSLMELSSENTKQFNKTVLTLSAGALALSIVFVKDIAPTINENTTYILISAWCLFAFTILSTLTSFLVASYESYNAQIEWEERIFKNKPYVGENILLWSDRLNFLSAVFFFLGVLLLITFCALNISNKVCP